jgi:mannose-6-phosphate isomerase-like protein (cupin superfamily)
VRPSEDSETARSDGADMAIEGLRADLLSEGRLPHDAGLSASRWSNGPHDRYGAHRHDYDKVLVVESGSIQFGLPELDRSADLAAGERLDLPAGTLHSADVGPRGVSCLEVHLPPGSLSAETAGTRRA